MAETFTFEMEEGQGLSLSDVAEIDSMVTVVDAVNFMKDMRAAEDLATRGLQAGEGSWRCLRRHILLRALEYTRSSFFEHTRYPTF